ncbi:hypothetical protein, conserved [Trypanosoma brucei gambiense DAL972]|uniref:tRNA (Uracil-5-)-methyltransferase n=1 Tax=Trypanosoma brucei gambiense (strain MHOM/CI/86/DAL972) TaxID=679716 RepID=C9ZIM3_TRYB9|nr:hypothetical protein, conserved [Trypanosoma brucei gambiense DAL972]CBH09015.1 hypothetical protein, conserved [Trypanosoma brucei gambiense DAL972]|eukprot:XP_011771456.1 hypothetical protein, conserved [Trypanosoma brucei gambiense DAL972]
MEGTESGTEQAKGSVPLRTHSNENLLKFDTHDKYSTVASVKKAIMRSLPPPKTNVPPQPLFTGLLRMAKSPNTPLLFLAFETPEHRAAAAEMLSTMSFRGRKPWHEVPVTPRDLQLTYKGAGRKRERTEDAEGRSKVTQWGGCPMEEQLQRKKEHCLQVMRAITLGGGTEYEKLFTGIHPSPHQTGYRNHVQFTFGFTEAGEPTIGFLKGSVIDGIYAVESVLEKDIETVNPLAKLVADAVMTVYHLFKPLEKGGLEVYDKIKEEGFWRRLQVRHNVLGEVMVDAEMDTESVAEDIVASVKAQLVAALQGETLRKKLCAAHGKDTANIVSVQYHHGTGMNPAPPEAPRHVLFGSATLTEHLLGLQFELSPTSFFQVNTAGMELLLRETVAVAELTPETTLLDLCCGTGTIGIALAKHVKRVIGIELVESAVRDARLNAERNGVRNATFNCGRVEHLLPSVISQLSPEDRMDIVAILDPPRAGVTPTVLKWIRGTATIRRLVYISCEQKALQRDCPPLTKPATKAYRESPFNVVAGFAIDMFPHTPHVEMVAVLSRSNSS